MIRKWLCLLVVICGACSDPVAPVSQAGGFVQVAAGAQHTCGLTVAGVAFCWGEGAAGQLGDGRHESSPVPVRVEGGVEFTELSAGALHTCGLDVSGVAYCWGANTRGQIGNNSTISQGFAVYSHTELRFASIASGWLHTCAATTAGEVYCWGSNGQSQAAGDEGGDQLVPEQVATMVPLGELSAGGFHTCGLNNDGAAYCWGSNAFGQLGTGSMDDSAVPVPVTGGHRFERIAAGYTHTCGVTDESRVLCWGSSLHGEMGTSGTSPPGLAGAMEPQQIAVRRSFTDVAAGYHTTCAVMTNGQAWCWGRGDDGQIGNGAFWDQPHPQPVADGDPATAPGIRSVSVGVAHACAVTRHNVALCWGRGDAGQLGSRSLTSSPIALRVSTE